MAQQVETTRRAAAPTALLADDWPAQTAETIDRVVGSIRDKTAVPLERVARLVVYGLLAGILGIAALTMLAVGIVRVLDVYIPVDSVWPAHLITGGIFTVTGLFLWSKRKQPTRK
jgi:hypothetical protein